MCSNVIVVVREFVQYEPEQVYAGQLRLLCYVVRYIMILLYMRQFVCFVFILCSVG